MGGGSGPPSPATSTTSTDDGMRNILNFFLLFL